MFDPSIYSSTAKLDEADGNWPPFPATSFVLHRLPLSGYVLRIEIKGPKLTPERVLPDDAISLTKLSDSLILKGSLDNLKTVMADAVRATKPDLPQ